MNCRNSRRRVHTHTHFLLGFVRNLQRERPRSRSINFSFHGNELPPRGSLVQRSTRVRLFVIELELIIIICGTPGFSLGGGEGERLTPVCLVSPMGKNDPFHGKPGLGAATLWNRWLARYEMASN